MNFLLPAGFALLALAIPILLLYMLKLRRKQAQVSSTLLWEQLLRDKQANAPWQKLKRNLLLFLQLLILAALVLAFARPAVPTPVVASGSVIVLLDASASMNATDVEPSRFETARRIVSALINETTAASRLTLILVGETPELLIAAESDKTLVQSALAKAEVTQGGADWASAFALAAGASYGSADVTSVIISDGGLPESGLPALPGEIRYVPIGESGANLAITALALRPTGTTSELFANIQNYSDEARSVLLSIYFGESLVLAHQLDLESNSSETLTLADLPATPGVYRARITNPQEGEALDAFTLDDTAFAVHQASSARRVLLVSEGNLFIEQALASLPGIQPFRALPADDGTLQIPNDPFGLYIFDGLAPAELPAGNLLFIDPPSNLLFETGATFTDMSAIRVHESPLTRYVDWSTVHVLQARTVTLPDWAEPLIEANGKPLVFAGETDSRRIAALTFDLRESDLPLQVTYPILFSNLINYLLPPSPFDATQSIQPGQSLVISPPPGTEQIIVASPSNLAYNIPLSRSTLTFTDTNELGYYAVNFLAGDSSTVEYFAVNLFDPTESNLSPREAIQVGQSAVTANVSDQIGLRELWRWLALVALIILVIEWQVYHRKRLPASLTRIVGGSR